MRLRDKPDCETCKLLKGDAWDAAHCEICVPPLLPENEEALLIYLAVQDQLITGFNGPVGLDQNAIHKAMDLYEIKDRRDCFEKVVALGRHIVGEQQKGYKK